MNSFADWLRAWWDVAVAVGWPIDPLIVAMVCCIVAALLIGPGKRSK